MKLHVLSATFLNVQHKHDSLTLLGPMVLSLFSASSASSQLLSSGSKTWFKAVDNVLPCGYFLLTSYLQQEPDIKIFSERLLDLACIQAVDVHASSATYNLHSIAKICLANMACAIHRPCHYRGHWQQKLVVNITSKGSYHLSTKAGILHMSCSMR